MKYLKLFETHAGYDAYINGGDVQVPNVSYCIKENEVHYNKNPHDYSKDYLTFEALQNGSVSFVIPDFVGTQDIQSISYSTDDGNTWAITNNKDNEQINITVNVNEGDKVLWKGTGIKTGSGSEDDGANFISDTKYNVYGNIMSLLYGDDFINEVTMVKHQFAYLFYGFNVVDASNLILPATTLEIVCYHNMFAGCTSLTTAPELPATTLTEACYASMFTRCSNLNYVKALFTEYGGAGMLSSIYQWLDNVSSTGTFVKSINATWVAGDDVIPSGWTVESI